MMNTCCMGFGSTRANFWAMIRSGKDSLNDCASVGLEQVLGRGHLCFTGSKIPHCESN
jgi:hypothetical protein